MYRTTLSVLFLVASLDLKVPVYTSQGSFARQDPHAFQREQISDLVRQDSSQKADQSNLPANSDKIALADGTAVRLRFVRAVVSSQVIAGEKVPLQVVEPVLVGSLIAIPQHAQAEATVTMAQAKRNIGRGGNLELKIESIRLSDGEAVPVRAVKDVKGGERKAVAIAAWSVWPFAVKGKNATVPAGTEITAYIAGDFTLDQSKFQTTVTSPQEKNVPK